MEATSAPAHLFRRLHQAVATSERVLLVAHKKPDGDTIGASSSFLNWLLREGKDVRVFCADLPPRMFRYLDNIHCYTNDPSVFDAAYDLVIVFDSGDLAYCGVDQHMPRLTPGYLLVNLDHHFTNTRYGDLNVVLTDASSTAEVVHQFFEENGIVVDHRMATCLLTGLCTDTSNFSNASTNPKAVQSASTLIAAGGRFHDIVKHIWHDQGLEKLKLWGVMLSRLQHNARYDIATTYVFLDEWKKVEGDAVEGMSNFLSAVSGTSDTVMVLKELPNGQVKGSLRSLSRDISKVAKLMGGGGHKKASGFTVNGRIDVKDGVPTIV